ALAVIDLAIDSWRDLRPEAGHLSTYVTPKSLSE
ncbi:MAG: hypothetical protein RLZZ444_274, partial [Pseudomonadota bacterium]